MVTHHDAAAYPKLAWEGQFDRVLCDVPCSGDGTLRKAPYAWVRWSPNFASKLHPLQFRIALRGARLLKVGGRMVYSTCSLNPLENEAVVSALLKAADGALRLVDARNELPHVKVREGVTSWPVMTKPKGKVLCENYGGWRWSILSRFWRILGVLVFGMSVCLSMSIWNGFGINGVMELEWINETKRSTVRFCYQNVDFAKFWKLMSKIMFQILNPNQNPSFRS